MRQVKVIQASFVSGALAKQAWGRSLSPVYANGADKLENVYIHPAGGVKKREGLKSIDAVKNDVGAYQQPKLASLIYNRDGASYLIAFFPSRLRIYRDDSYITTLGTREWTDKDPNMSVLNKFTSRILDEMKIIQATDALIITHKDLPPLTLIRKDDLIWELKEIQFKNIPYYAPSVREVDATLDITLSNIDSYIVTASVSSAWFSRSDIGQLIVHRLGGIIRITEFVSTTSVKGIKEQEFYNPTNANPLVIKYDNWFSENGYQPSWSSSLGYPSVSCFYQRRLWFGGLKSRPTALIGSRVDEYFNLQVDDSDDSAIDIELVDNELNEIVNLYPGRNLQIYTVGDENYIPQDDQSPITPANIKVKRSTNYGSSIVAPVSIDGAVVFVDRSGKVVREFVYSEQEDSYTANPLSYLASHLIHNPKRIAVKKPTDSTPIDYLMFVNDKDTNKESGGTISVMNLWRAQELLAWSTFRTEGDFLDVVSVDTDIYVVVERIFGGRPVYNIEKFDAEYLLDGAILSSSQSQPNTIFNSSFFVNPLMELYTKLGSYAKIQVRSMSPNRFELSDNHFPPSGDMVIEVPYNQIEIGLGFDIRVKVLPIDGNDRYTSFTADKKRLCQVLVNTYKTSGFNVVVGDTVVYTSTKTFINYNASSALPEVSEWIQVDVGGGVYRDLQVELTYKSPIRFEIISLVLKVAL